MFRKFAETTASVFALSIFLSLASAHAQNFTVLYTFTGGSDGASPSSGLIKDRAGYLYGTTVLGGGNGCNAGSGCGTVFALEPDGTELKLYAFQGGSDGSYPEAGLVIGAGGNFYGTASGGGTGCNNPGGCGTVFKVSPAGVFGLLHSFAGSDGSTPNGTLLKGAGGYYYGMTYEGGGSNSGAAYRLARNGTEFGLYSFSLPTGAFPLGNLIVDSQGNFYGTTYDGGSSGCYNGDGCGAVFKLTPAGVVSWVYFFQGGSDGAYPQAGLVMDRNGNLYGTASGGGIDCDNGSSCGTVFRLTPAGVFTVVHAFSGGSDGELPIGSLVIDRRGNIYGTTIFGGGATCGSGSGCGTVFEIDPNQVEAVLHAFNGGSDGAYPVSNLLMGTGGYLYGTASQGGGTGCSGLGCGTIFKVKNF